MTAKEYLEKVKEKQKYWERKNAELEQLKALETNTTVTLKQDPVQSSGDKDRQGSLISKRIDFETEVVNKALQDFFDYRDECIRLLELLQETNNVHYVVLHRKYIEYVKLKEIAKEEGYCYQYVKDLHTEALENFEKILKIAKVPT